MLRQDSAQVCAGVGRVTDCPAAMVASSVNEIRNNRPSFFKKIMSTSRAIEDPKYKPGQVWSYRHRYGEEGSTFTVLKVEDIESQGKHWETIIHIRVDNVSIKLKDGSVRTVIPHIPLPRKSVEESAIELLDPGSNKPNFNSSTWLTNLRDNEGGIITVSVAKALDIIEEALKRNPKAW